MSEDEKKASEGRDLADVAERIRARSEAGATRRRARPTSGTEFATPVPRVPEPPSAPHPEGRTPSLWLRQDLWIVVAALTIFAAGTLLHRRLTAPRTVLVRQGDLALQRPAGWLPGEVEPPTSPLAALVGSDSDGDVAARRDLPHHVVYTSPLDPIRRIELRIDRRPSSPHLRGVLALERAARHGAMHWSSEASEESIGGRDWARTRFRYPYRGARSGSPRIAAGIEYAVTDPERLYVVTLHGTADTVEELESMVVPTLVLGAGGGSR